MNLYDAIIAAGIQIDSHESDLYFPVTEQTTAILAKFPTEKEIARTFQHTVKNQLWYEVPFGFLPFWDKKPR